MFQLTTLREARKQSKLDKFITEHGRDKLGDLHKLDAALKRPTQGTEKSDQEASKPDPADD